jgi:dTDP-4-dehydrorhamnose reductase
MNRVLVLGAGGMLGSTLMRTLPGLLGCEVLGTLRQPSQLAMINSERLLTGIHADDFSSIERVLDTAQPDALINCIGLIKQLKEGQSPVPCIQINALLPHRLATACQQRGIRLIHVSTDCVFSGSRGNYSEQDIPDPPDVYGQSKLLGEVHEGGLTLRTSIIGHEPSGKALSLIDWFLGAKGHLRGFTRAIYSGLPTVELARVMALVLRDHPQLQGLHHVSAEPIDKYRLLQIVQRVYGKTDALLQADDSFVIDRSLSSQSFRQLTGWASPNWESLITTMHQDYIACKTSPQ